MVINRANVFLAPTGIAVNDLVPLLRSLLRRSVFTFSTLCCLCPDAIGSNPDDAAALFEAKIRPLLIERCVKCHGADQAESGLRLDRAEDFFRGGESGKIVIAGNPDDSRMIRAVRQTGELKMPPDRKLSAPEIQFLETWVRQGAKWPDYDQTAKVDPRSILEQAKSALHDIASQQDKQHPNSILSPVKPADGQSVDGKFDSFWAFRPVRVFEPPSVNHVDWPQSGIDYFVLNRLEKRGLTPAPSADRRTLIRRVSYVLLGLPPSPEQVEAFASDPSTDREAFTKLVDQFLSSPQYGERWGRLWLDVARYADSGGYETDIYYRNAWRYRDYVVKSFNDDKPYDVLVQEQLAGDEIWPGNLDLEGNQLLPETQRRKLEARIGTGLFSLGPQIHESKAAPFESTAARNPHFAPRATSVISLFMQGGPSQVDTFDPKPELERLKGQPLPPSFAAEGLQLQFMPAKGAALMPSPFAFQRYGESGLPVSEIFRNVGQHADRLAVIRSCHHESFIHGTALSMMHTGSLLLGHPSVGAWVVYGLGCESDNLPAYVVMSDNSVVRNGVGSYGSGFLPAVHQGTVLRTEGAPIQNLAPPSPVWAGNQRAVLNQIGSWNRRYTAARPDDSRLEARIANYELAFRMQSAAPELVDLSGETASTHGLYGLDAAPTERFGRMCLLARRMVERGVRYVQLFCSDWDGHGDCAGGHRNTAAAIDRPIAGLISDLAQRGLLAQLPQLGGKNKNVEKI